MYKTNGQYEDFINTNYTYGVNDIPISEPLKVISTDDKVKSLKIAASIHKEVRKIIRSDLKPGTTLSTLATNIENNIKLLTNNKGINNGIGFPSGLSVNECAAHFTPHKKLDIKLDNNSIIKVDYGVEVNGWIIDSAFTVSFNDKYKNLLDAVKDATYTGIKNAGVDVNIKEWSKDIQEVMESYEIILNGKVYPIKAIRNLGGHNIMKNKIHGGVFLPASYVDYYPDNLKFKEGVYAIETFGSTMSDTVIERNEENTIYMNKALTTSKVPKKKQKFYKNILNKFITIPYCNRFLDNLYENCKDTMEILTNNNIVTPYPPLYCSKGGMTAQYEHTVYLSDKGKIILSSCKDY